MTSAQTSHESAWPAQNYGKIHPEILQRDSARRANHDVAITDCFALASPGTALRLASSLHRWTCELGLLQACALANPPALHEHARSRGPAENTAYTLSKRGRSQPSRWQARPSQSRSSPLPFLHCHHANPPSRTRTKYSRPN